MQIRGVCFDHILLCTEKESHKKKFNSEKAILNHSKNSLSNISELGLTYFACSFTI